MKTFALLEKDDRVLLDAAFAERESLPRLKGVVTGYRQWHTAGTLVSVRRDLDGEEELYAPHLWQREKDGAFGRDLLPGDAIPGAGQAIETAYGGYRFRSRLEARWAILFDVMAIPWEYEVQGIALPSGWYLPDFFLPKLRMYAEVKPGTFSVGEQNKCFELADATGCICLMLTGTPAVQSYYAALPSEDPKNIVQELASLVITNRKGCITNEGRLYADATHGDVFEDTEYAVKVARSARFEHGETGPMVVRVEAGIAKQ